MPASQAPTRTANQPADLLADFRVAQPKRALYSHALTSPRADVRAVSDAAFVTRGSHTKSGAPVLLVVDGSSMSALPLAAIGAAIAGGVITRDEISALIGEKWQITPTPKPE